jgi:hypothetical protein
MESRAEAAELKSSGKQYYDASMEEAELKSSSDHYDASVSVSVALRDDDVAVKTEHEHERADDDDGDAARNGTDVDGDSNEEGVDEKEDPDAEALRKIRSGAVRKKISVEDALSWVELQLHDIKVRILLLPVCIL